MVRKLFLIISILFLFHNNLYSQGGVYVESMPTTEIKDIKHFIQQEIKYPLQAIRDSTEGTVVIQFVVDKECGTSKYKVIHGIRNDLDEEALRVAKLIKFKKPALLREKEPVSVKYTLVVDFKLPWKKSNNNTGALPLPNSDNMLNVAIIGHVSKWR